MDLIQQSRQQRRHSLDVLPAHALRLELSAQVRHRPHLHVAQIGHDGEVVLLVALVRLGAEVDPADAAQLGALVRRQLVLGARLQARQREDLNSGTQTILSDSK